jgi:hypothetical protein
VIHEPELFEGHVLDYDGAQYRWYYTERGQLNVLKTFELETDAVNFAFSKISKSETARRHMIGFLPHKLKIKDLLDKLDGRDIKYEVDEIPYNDEFEMHTRVFVVGCDVQKVEDLKGKYIDNS